MLVTPEVHTISKSAAFGGLSNTVTGRIKSWSCHHASTQQSRQCGLGGVYSSACTAVGESWWTSWTRASDMPLWWRTIQNHILGCLNENTGSRLRTIIPFFYLGFMSGAWSTVSGFGLSSNLERTHLFLRWLLFWPVHLVYLNWES